MQKVAERSQYTLPIAHGTHRREPDSHGVAASQQYGCNCLQAPNMYPHLQVNHAFLVVHKFLVLWQVTPDMTYAHSLASILERCCKRQVHRWLGIHTVVGHGLGPLDVAIMGAFNILQMHNLC